LEKSKKFLKTSHIIMQKYQNSTNQNQTNLSENNNLGQNKSNNSSSLNFNISGGISSQGATLFGNNQLNNANLSVVNNNSPKLTEQSGTDEEIKQPVENNSSTSTSSEGCCSLKIGKLGCGNVVSFWCFNLEPGAEDVYLVCCPKGSKEQAQQETEDSTNNQTQYQSVPQMEAQVQIDPK
jgi:hypothetical protein